MKKWAEPALAKTCSYAKKDKKANVDGEDSCLCY